MFSDQALRRNIQELQPALPKPGHDFSLLIGRLAGIQELRFDAELTECGDLILHQRNERRHDQARSLPQHGRNLVAQGLAAACRHDHQGVAALERGLDDRLLLSTELRVAEDIFQNVPG